MKSTFILLILLLSIGLQAQNNDQKDDKDHRIRQATEKVISIREDPNYDRLDKLFKEADAMFNYVAKLDQYKTAMKKLNSKLNKPKTKKDAQLKPK